MGVSLVHTRLGLTLLQSVCSKTNMLQHHMAVSGK